MQTIVNRVNYADSSADITVICDGESMTLQAYENSVRPTVYRFTHTSGQTTGYIAAVDYVKNGVISKVELFASIEEVGEYIEEMQGGDGNYYIASRFSQPLELAGGLEAFKMPAHLDTFEHLRDAIQKERAKVTKELYELKQINEVEAIEEIEESGDEIEDGTYVL